ncbi:uncharacterized protein LOC135469184 isoform X2 [Liolophura sinensis]|uniref:uncharacterized protein LOC135469184 isoform X2 n=1 Tax=Liolophura sinensis TaxID=3198878 RepID=UPI0031595274
MPAAPHSQMTIPSDAMRRIGILGVQGAFSEHKAALLKANALLVKPVDLEIVDVRSVDDIRDDIDGLIIPGGESTVISMFLRRNKMEDRLRSWIRNENHVTWGTCAGMILLAERSEHQKDGGQPQIGGLDIVVDRNFFGRQVHSFEADVKLAEVPDLRQRNKTGVTQETFSGVFIRAPAVVKIMDPAVSVLATLDCPSRQTSDLAVAVRQNNLMATAFHPELTEDPTWHLYFLKTVLNLKVSSKR